jgi:hypothetical protein
MYTLQGRYSARGMPGRSSSYALKHALPGKRGARRPSSTLRCPSNQREPFQLPRPVRPSRPVQELANPPVKVVPRAKRPAGRLHLDNPPPAGGGSSAVSKHLATRSRPECVPLPGPPVIGVSGTPPPPSQPFLGRLLMGSMEECQEPDPVSGLQPSLPTCALMRMLNASAFERDDDI